MSQKAEIKTALSAAMERGLDDYMSSHGFTRRKGGLAYKRDLNGAEQSIDLQLEVFPKDNLNAAAAVYPVMEVQIPTVDECLKEMISGNNALLTKQPIGFTSQKEDPGRWYIYQADSVPGVVDDVQAFIDKWTMPFLEEYSTAEDVVAAHERKDGRMVVDRAHLMRVVAAALVLDRQDSARGIMEEWFGAPSLRKRYQDVSTYVEKSA